MSFAYCQISFVCCTFNLKYMQRALLMEWPFSFGNNLRVRDSGKIRQKRDAIEHRTGIKAGRTACTGRQVVVSAEWDKGSLLYHLMCDHIQETLNDRLSEAD